MMPELIAEMAVAGARDDIGRCKAAADKVFHALEMEGIMACCVALARIFHNATGMSSAEEEVGAPGYFGFQAKVLDERTGEMIDLGAYDGDDDVIIATRSAIRWMIALGNNDLQTAAAVMTSTTTHPFLFLWELSRLAGQAWVDSNALHDDVARYGAEGITTCDDCGSLHWAGQSDAERQHDK